MLDAAGRESQRLSSGPRVAVIEEQPSRAPHSSNRSGSDRRDRDACCAIAASASEGAIDQASELSRPDQQVDTDSVSLRRNRVAERR